MTARRRVLSIWLPHLAIERWAKASDCAPETPVILTVEATHGPVIHAVTEAAGERGARPGARLTDARAIDPTLVAIPADPDGDTALLQRLARWASRWSPVVEMDGADALRLDVSGVAHLFGGEAGLIADVQARFARVGLRVRTAIAPTAGAAWALSHFAPSSIVTPAKAGAQFSSRRDAEAQSGRASASLSGFSASLREIKEQLDSRFRGNDENDLASLLASLPVAALRLPPQAVRTLERLGLKTIAQLAGIERRSLARRFREADNPVDALDRMLGRKPEPLTAVPDNPPPRATLRLEEPATHSEAAPQALQRLIPELVKQLESRRLGARRLALTGFRVDGSVAIASVATSIASREPRHLQRLLAGVIADGPAALDPGFGFDAFALEASWAEPLGAAQDSLVEEPDGEADVARLVDRLSVKLGAERVRRPCTVESHAPERASGWVTAVSSMRGASAAKQSSSAALDCFASLAMTTRPHRLLDQPEAIAVVYATPEGLPRRFVWRRAVHDIARVEGPERIAPEWWRERSTARLRDYYRVEDREGRRYWIYREGVFGDRRGGAPEWFLHGLFG